jgi:hypothetical protein
MEPDWAYGRSGHMLRARFRASIGPASTYNYRRAMHVGKRSGPSPTPSAAVRFPRRGQCQWAFCLIHGSIELMAILDSLTKILATTLCQKQDQTYLPRGYHFLSLLLSLSSSFESRLGHRDSSPLLRWLHRPEWRGERSPVSPYAQ